MSKNGIRFDRKKIAWSWRGATLLGFSLFTFGCAAGGGGQGAGGGDDSGASSSSGSGEDLSGRKRVFITQTTYDGDLANAGGAATGLEGGDKLCMISAEAAAIGGLWKAWLSDASTDAIDRIEDVGPWYLMDRTTKVFNNKANLATIPLDEIKYDENGNSVVQTGYTHIWTGTKNGGRKDDDDILGHCYGWQSNSDSQLGMAGDGGDGSFPKYWTESVHMGCYKSQHLHCFEQ